MDNSNLEIYLKMIESRIDQLVQIYITNRNENGKGMLCLNFCDKEKLDVFYNSIYDKENECSNSMFPSYLLSYLEHDIPSSIIFFNLFDNDGNNVVTIDLDKKSDFLNKLTK